MRELLRSAVVCVTFWFGPTCASSPSVDRRQESGAVDSSRFLRRAYHSSVVLDGWLYIDGGEFSYLSSAGRTYLYSNTLLAIDLSKDFTSSSVQIRSISKPDNVPSTRYGGIWADEKNKLLYTGFAGINSAFPGGDVQYFPTGLWSFAPDGKGSGSWTNLNATAPPEFRTTPRPFQVLSTSGNGKGYYLGGHRGNFFTAIKEEIPLSSLITYDFASNSMRNDSVTGISFDGQLQKGGMIYVPSFGLEGVIVAIGGAQRSKRLQNIDFLPSLDIVKIYDPAQKKWFEQTTTGSAPAARKEHCIAGAASNNRTFEILVYAGWGGDLGNVAIPFDTAYVLSLPSFHWFKANYRALRPRHGLTCHSIGGGKIITIGGGDTTIEGPPSLYQGVFNSPDTFSQGIGMFDLSTLSFTDSYTSTDRVVGYNQAQDIQDYYNKNGRNPTFDSPALADLFKVENFTAQATVTPGVSGSGIAISAPNSQSSTNIGAIVGGVIGGVIGGLALIALIIGGVLIRLRKKRHGNPPPQFSSDDPRGRLVWGAGAGERIEVAGAERNSIPDDLARRTDGPYELVSRHPAELPSSYHAPPPPEITECYCPGGHDQRSYLQLTPNEYEAKDAVVTERLYGSHDPSTAPPAPCAAPQPQYYPYSHSTGPMSIPDSHPQQPSTQRPTPVSMAQTTYQQGPVPMSATRQVHEIQGHQDGRILTQGEENFKYNIRF